MRLKVKRDFATFTGVSYAPVLFRLLRCVGARLRFVRAVHDKGFGVLVNRKIADMALEAR